MQGRSVNLETEEFVEDRELLIGEAVKAVEETKIGSYVNLVTAEVHGDPQLYLAPVLEQRFGRSVQMRYIDQCGCGGFVYRVDRLAAE